MKKPRFSGQKSKHKPGLENLLGIRSESCRSPTWPLPSTSLAHRLQQRYLKATTQTKLGSLLLLGELRRDIRCLTSSPTQGGSRTRPNISLPGAVSGIGQAGIKNRLTEDFSSDSIPSGLLCTRDSYIRVWRLRLLAVSWTLLHNTESLSHCLQVLRASAWAGGSGWQGLSDLAQILDFITPVTLLECFKIKELPSLFPCLFQVKGQKHNQKTPPSAKAARPITSFVSVFPFRSTKAEFPALKTVQPGINSCCGMQAFWTTEWYCCTYTNPS